MPDTFWARTDSGSANNPALNLTGDAAIQIVFVPSGGSGDLFLEQPTGGGVDPDTQVDIGGTLYSFTFELSADLPTLKKDGAQQVPDQFEGLPGYIVTVQDYPTTGETTRLFFLADGSASQADMDAFGNGAIDLQNVDTTPPPGAVCFAAGTKILTPKGAVSVEDLRVGDLVTTKDDAALPIRWIGTTECKWPGSSEASRPILISEGALAPGVPTRNLVISPQHKVLMSGQEVSELFDEAEVLAPAMGLSGMPGIRMMNGKRAVTYFHVLLDRHAILFAEGAATESFFPGNTAMEMLQTRQRSEIEKLFPALAESPDGVYGPQARKCLTRRQSEQLAAQLRKSRRPEATVKKRILSSKTASPVKGI